MLALIQSKALELFDKVDLENTKDKLNFDSFSDFAASVQTEHLIIAGITILAVLGALSTARMMLKVSLLAVAALVAFKLLT